MTDASVTTAIEPTLRIRFYVTAYNESGRTGYGEDASRDFDNERDAVAYARSLDQDYLRPSVTKHITMDPISIKIPHMPEPAQ